jgi:hypothetical protein
VVDLVEAEVEAEVEVEVTDEEEMRKLGDPSPSLAD